MKIIGIMAGALLVAACATPTATPAPTVTITQEVAPTREAPAPAATASNNDDLYMAFLESEGIRADRETSIEVARSVCEALDAGYSPTLLGAMAQDSGFTRNQAAAIIAASIVVYCPWNETKVNS
jgi:predicted alpha/beta hydrolase family esterase